MSSEKLQNEIQEKYKIGDINRVTRLAGGYWNTVLRLEANINDYVLRISHPTTNIERLNYEHFISWSEGEPSILKIPLACSIVLDDASFLRRSFSLS